MCLPFIWLPYAFTPLPRFTLSTHTHTHSTSSLLPVFLHRIFRLFNKIAFARNSCELHDVISLFMNTEKARDLKWNVFFLVVLVCRCCISGEYTLLLAHFLSVCSPSLYLPFCDVPLSTTQDIPGAWAMRVISCHTCILQTFTIPISIRVKMVVETYVENSALNPRTHDLFFVTAFIFCCCLQFWPTMDLWFVVLRWNNTAITLIIWHVFLFLKIVDTHTHIYISSCSQSHSRTWQTNKVEHFVLLVHRFCASIVTLESYTIWYTLAEWASAIFFNRTD